MVDDFDYHLDENLELIESEEVQSDLQALDCCLAMDFLKNMLVTKVAKKDWRGSNFFFRNLKRGSWNVTKEGFVATVHWCFWCFWWQIQ